MDRSRELRVECAGCPVRGSACAGCVVTALYAFEPHLHAEVPLDFAEQSALELFVDLGLVSAAAADQVLVTLEGAEYRHVG